ncbi:MAG: hypothetical protein ACXVCY_07960 [Pseudobdellovibrionaceae bacterium]
MRFLLLSLFVFSSSISIAKGTDLNQTISELSKQESRLHRKLLRSLHQNTQISVAYNDRIERIKGSEVNNIKDDDFSVRLVPRISND